MTDRTNTAQCVGDAKSAVPRYGTLWHHQSPFCRVARSTFAFSIFFCFQFAFCVFASVVFEISIAFRIRIVVVLFGFVSFLLNSTHRSDTRWFGRTRICATSITRQCALFFRPRFARMLFSIDRQIVLRALRVRCRAKNSDNAIADADVVKPLSQSPLVSAKWGLHC